MYSVNGEYGHWKKDNVSEKGKQTEDETTYIFVPGSKNPIIAWYAYKERIPPDKPKGFMMKKICKLGKCKMGFHICKIILTDV